MAKVFRFHQGSDHIEDWQNSTIYGKTAIEGIKDPSGATATKEITSIPSPFARIDLVKTAFEHVVNSRQVDGKTIFHKMISDALDVGEIFFNIDTYQNKVSIITWDINRDLESLRTSSNPRHRLLGETLKLYIDQDANAYNFDKTERLYLLNSKEGRDEINIIGGTSPITLFFTTANKLDYTNIRFGNDKAFDGEFQPLYKRDFNYIKFLFGFRRSLPDFSRDFKAFYEYLNLTLHNLTAEQRSEILNYTDFEIDFERLTVQGDNNFVEVLGNPLRKKTERSINISDNSGFVIRSDKYRGEKKPLVLPVDTYTDKTIYTTAVWDRENKIPFQDSRSLQDRTLPLVEDRYPYLTISDFLEPYIIRTIYPIYGDKFFDGNLSVSSGTISKGYLLPVKKAYFDFFDVKDLMGTMNDGKKALEIKESSSGGVNVVLRIPIKNNKYITYQRTYYPPAEEYQLKEPEIERNRGAVVEHQFGLAVYPFLKVENETNNHYRVALIDRDIQAHTSHIKYGLDFYAKNGSEKLREVAVKQRSDKEQGDSSSSKYYVIEHTFDFFELKTNYAKALVIPRFRLIRSGASEFTFAIDFGTSNTHIEYSKDRSEPQPLEITKDDIQVGTLFNLENAETKFAFDAYTAHSLNSLLYQEFIPREINQSVEYQFPQRTIINFPKTLDFNTSTYVLGDFNIPFVYEKYHVQSDNIKSNLKWSDITVDTKSIRIIEAFFENLLLLIRNKVLLNGGNLSKTKLKWLYPSSMSKFRVNKLEAKWSDLFKKYINDEETPEKISESIVPFYYHKKKGIEAITHKVVSIDIGGGTTDVVVYQDNKPQILSSFRFATNAIFGDAYGRSSSVNGFVGAYLNRFKTLLETNRQYDLIKVLDSISVTGKSEDIISFLFSIERNKNIIEQNIPISFSKELSINMNFKIVFMVFYSAIIYHIAKLLKEQGVQAPKYITFSGTGSKVINVIDNNKKLNILVDFTKIIFEQVFEDSSVDDIQLIQVEYPKEISAKGALLIEEDEVVDVSKIKRISLGTSKDKTFLTYNDLNNEIEKDIIKEYLHFIDTLFSLNKTIPFKDYFGINPKNLDSYRNYLTENALDDLKLGIKEKVKELNGELDAEIDETLFFYPLIGALNHLAFKIQTDLNQ